MGCERFVSFVVDLVCAWMGGRVVCGHFVDDMGENDMALVCVWIGLLGFYCIGLNIALIVDLDLAALPCLSTLYVNRH
jgi:hypothetical protein